MVIIRRTPIMDRAADRSGTVTTGYPLASLIPALVRTATTVIIGGCAGPRTQAPSRARQFCSRCGTAGAAYGYIGGAAPAIIPIRAVLGRAKGSLLLRLLS